MLNSLLTLSQGGLERDRAQPLRTQAPIECSGDSVSRHALFVRLPPQRRPFSSKPNVAFNLAEETVFLQDLPPT